MFTISLGNDLSATFFENKICFEDQGALVGVLKEDTSLNIKWLDATETQKRKFKKFINDLKTGKSQIITSKQV
jgi:hypothetical protein